MQSTRGPAICAAIALMAGGLAACGDDEPTEPTTTASPISVDTKSPSSSSSTSSSTSDGSATSSAGVAPLPAAAKKRTKEGAIAFNEFYQVQMGEALKTNSSLTLTAYSKGCAVCDGLAERVKNHKNKGIHMDKNPNSIESSSARKRTDAGYRVEVTVNAAEYHEVLKNGSKGRTAKALKMTLVSNTQWSDGQWQIIDIVRTK